MNAIFNEVEWMRIIYLLADTESWIKELFSKSMEHVPIPDKRRLFRKTYFLTPKSLVHILERHYYKIPRHPGAGKFTIPVTDILHWIREGSGQQPSPVEGSLNLVRCFDTGMIIGYDRQGQPTNILTIITNAAGEIQTAFPGHIAERAISIMEEMAVPLIANS